MADSTEYVVVATQINRYDKDADEFTTMRRGDSFAAGDVDEKELKRWLGLKPAVIRSREELATALQTTADAQATIADLQAQLAAARAELAEQTGAGAAVTPDAADALGGTPSAEPAGNASVDDWRAYALSVVGDDPAEVERVNAASRDDLRKEFSTKTA